MEQPHHGGWSDLGIFRFTSGGPKGFRNAAACLLLILALAFRGHAQDAFFEDADPGSVVAAKAAGARVGGEEGTLRSRVVRIPGDRLAGPKAAVHNPSPAFLKRNSSRLRLNLFPDLEPVVVVERTDYLDGTRYVAHGSVEGAPDSLVLLSVDGTTVAATVSVPGRNAVKVRHLGDGLHEVVELDPADVRPCEPLQAGLAGGAGKAVERAAGGTGGVRQGGAKAASTRLDVMVVYTTAAKNGAGGESGIRSLINLAVAEANDTYTRSRIDAELNLVYAGEVAYGETGNANTDLGRLQNPSDGQLDAVQGLRNQYGADIVCLFTEAMSYYAGLGYVMSPPRSGFSEYAYSVVRRMYATGQYVFAHEVGHNLGCQHDRNNANTAGSYGYSYGHRFTASGTTYRTVMAYAPGVPIPHFSNPTVTYLGVATGVPSNLSGSADNAQTINLTAPVAAGFRGQGTIVQMESATLAVAESAGTATVRIVRSGDVTRQSTVWFAVTGVTAAAGSDFTAVATQQLTFDVGETNKSVTIPILDDTLVEPAETIRVNLGQPAGAALGSVTATVVTLQDDDSSVGFAAPSASVLESAGSVRLEVRRMGSVAGAASVSYATAAGTATAGQDFEGATGTLDFAVGATNAFITVPVTDDTSVESNEAFTVTLSSPSGTRLGSVATAAVQVLEDDCRLGLGAAAVSVLENAGQVVVTVARSGGTAAAVTATLATTAGTATAGSDFTAVSTTVRFNAGETSKSVAVPILNDASVEFAETFAVALSDFAGGAQAGTVVSETVTLVDNDSAFSVATPAENVAETVGAKAVVVRRTGSLNTPATVRYAATGGTATVSADFAGVSGVLSFAANEASKSVSVPIVNDTVVESDETVLLTLSSPTAEAVIGSDSVATLTIQDNDLFTFAIDPVAASASENAGSVRLTITRSGRTDAAATVVVGTRDETARAGSDYTAVNTTLSFAGGETSKTVDVPLLDDTLVEANETFRVLLSSPTGGGVLGSAGSAQVTVVENDVSLVFAAAAYAVGENTNSVVLTVRRGGNTNAAVSVDYATVDGVATAGSDYAEASGTLRFDAGEVSKTVAVTVLDDAAVEANEAFSVRLQNPTGALLGTPSTAAVTVLEDDCRLQFAATNYPVLENAGRVTLVVQRVGGTIRQVGATVRTGEGTASAGSDYTATAAALVFLPGETSKTVLVPVLNDSAIEGDETVPVGLDTFSGTEAGTNGTTTVRVVDNDSVLHFYAHPSVAENAGRVEVWVVRAGSLAAPATVRFSTANGTAAATADYTALSGTLSFAAGQDSKLIAIALRDDALVEGNEEFTVVLSSPTGEAVLGSTNVARVTLVENDLFAYGFASTTASAAEGSGSVRLTVTRTGNTAGASTVVLSTRDESARAGTDYTAANTTVAFAADETSRTVDIPVLDDSSVESTETFLALLSAPTGGGVLGTSSNARVSILEDDVGLALSSTAYSAGENAGTVALSVRRTGNTNTAVSVSFATTNLTAAGGSDFVSTNGTVELAVGEVLKSFNVALVDDSEIEPNETFSVGLSSPSGAVLASPSSAVVTVLEDDCRLQLAGTNFVVLENAGRFAVNVVRQGGLLRAARATLRTSDGTASAGSDYAALDTTVSVAAGQSSAVAYVTLVNDTEIDADENLTLTLSDPVNAVLGTPSSAVLTLRNTDSTYSFFTNRTFLENAARAELWVVRSGGLAAPSTVRWATANGTAAAGSDYVAAGGVLSFAAGQDAKLIQVTLRDDTVREGDEAFSVVLSSPTAEAVLGSFSTATVTLTDNEAAGAVFDTVRLSLLLDGGKSVPRLRLVGPEGARVRVESSTDLASWTEAAVVDLGAGEAFWSDSDAGSDGRFYRVVPLDPPAGP